MASIALIGPDGAGKTTITRLLAESSSWPIKPIYMGDNISASNHALPTSRLARYLLAGRNGNPEAEGRRPEITRRGNSAAPSLSEKLWAVARIAGHLADEWYRQLLSWAYQTLGYLVLYDRHYCFDFRLEGISPNPPTFDQRLHRWFLSHFYPRPDLVIYLDAPAEVLFARKGEKSITELEQRRRAYIQQGMRMPNFVRIDATLPLAQVCTQVAHHIAQFHQAGQPQPPRQQQRMEE